MTDFALWTRGMREPQISVLRGRSQFTAYERDHYLSGPFKLTDEQASLSLTELSKLFPAPPWRPDEPQMSVNPPTKPRPPTGAAVSQEAI